MGPLRLLLLRSREVRFDSPPRAEGNRADELIVTQVQPCEIVQLPFLVYPFPGVVGVVEAGELDHAP